jgi:hypothetical protein
MILTVWIRLLSAMPIKKSKSHSFEYTFIDYPPDPSFPPVSPHCLMELGLHNRGLRDFLQSQTVSTKNLKNEKNHENQF